MLSVAECKAILDDETLSEEEVLVIRDSLYSVCEQVISKHYDTITI